MRNICKTAVVASLLLGCTVSDSSTLRDHAQAIWSVDFIRVLPGGEEDYLTNIRGNWAQARRIALDSGDVLSFVALRAEADSSLGWDIMLMTEYADSTRWNDREEIFRRIFDSPEFLRVEIDRPSSELREFVNGGVVLSPIASSASEPGR